jgi:hypothetical protein
MWMLVVLGLASYNLEAVNEQDCRQMERTASIMGKNAVCVFVTTSTSKTASKTTR